MDGDDDFALLDDNHSLRPVFIFGGTVSKTTPCNNVYYVIWFLHKCFTTSFYSPGRSVELSSILLGLVLVGRATFVFPLSFLSNLTKKSRLDQISLKQQVLA